MGKAQPTATEFTAVSFDMIIVGGGTAGLVLAARLSANPSLVIGVLEAGKDHLDDLRVLIPGMCPSLAWDEEYNWKFSTTEQKQLNKRTIGWPRGRMLGGSSAINFLQVAFPTAQEIDSWGLLGNHGWNWTTLLPYYRKFHTYHTPSTQVAKHSHVDHVNPDDQGRSGPIQVSLYEGCSPLQTAWLGAWEELGSRMESDNMSGNSEGGFTNAASVDPTTKTRSFAGSAYLKPVIGRPNLHVLTEALASKIVFADRIDDKEELRASGVSFIWQEREYFAKVNNTTTSEVILCAGTVQSPQVLELSGIGSSDILTSQNIEVLIDNSNVGENLQDHALTAMSFEVADGVPSMDMLQDPILVQQAVEAYQSNQTGPLASGVEASAFLGMVESPKSTTSSSISIFDLVKNHDHASYTPGRQKQYFLQTDLLLNAKDGNSVQYMLLPFQLDLQYTAHDQAALFKPSHKGNYISLTATLEHPYSRGCIHIVSPTPQDHPRIDPKYLSHPLDQEILARHAQYLDQLACTDSLSALLKPGPNRRRILASPTSTELAADVEVAKQLIRNDLTTQYHPVGTCAMMPREYGGVVDDRLRVYGTKNLRVVDASIIPIHIRGNIQSTVYAIAEYAADMILEDMSLLS